MDNVDDGGLEAGEAEIVGAPGDMGPGELKGVGVAQLRRLVDVHPAGVRKPHRPGGLVKRLPRRVVPGAADDVEPGIIQHLDDMAMAAGGDHTEERRLKVGVGQVVARHMGTEVMGRDNRLAGREGEALGVVDPHQQRADQPRRVGDGDGVDVPKGQPRLLHRPVDHPADVLTVPPRGDFRYDAAVFAVLLHLGGDDRGEDFPPVFDNGRRRLVAGAFDAQDFDAVVHILRMFLSVSGTDVRPHDEAVFGGILVIVLAQADFPETGGLVKSLGRGVGGPHFEEKGPDAMLRGEIESRPQKRLPGPIPAVFREGADAV